jgi:hypothetical protein
MTTATPTTKIVIVSGQEFSVPADTSEKDLRDHLAATFPDVATATVQKGTKTIDGVTYQTIEFVKKAGTKGASGAELAALLAQVRPQRLGAPPDATVALITRVIGGQLTIDAALTQDALAALAAMPAQPQKNGGTLCSQLDIITPVAAAGADVW